MLLDSLQTIICLKTFTLFVELASLKMGYWFFLAPIVTFSESVFSGAPSRTCSFLTTWSKGLLLGVVKYDCERGCRRHFSFVGSFVSVRRIDCDRAGAALQRRAFSIDKGKRWAVAAAAVTLSKRRQMDTKPWRNFEDDSASGKNQSPSAEIDSRCEQSNAASVHQGVNAYQCARHHVLPPSPRLALKERAWLLCKKMEVEAVAFAAGMRKLQQDFRYASQLLLTPGLPLSSRHIAHIRHTSIDVLRMLPFLALAILPGGGVAIAAAVKFAPWLLPSPFQQKQVVRLMTLPNHALTPLTQHELWLQQQSRIKLYEGLSEGLRVAIQASEAQMLKDMQVVAAVISAANELKQASKSESHHVFPSMLLALHTRALQDDRWLVVLPREVLLQMMSHLELKLGGWGWNESQITKVGSACKQHLQIYLGNHWILSIKSAIEPPFFVIQFWSSLKSTTSAIFR
jgi:hypothetical protein